MRAKFFVAVVAVACAVGAGLAGTGSGAQTGGAGGPVAADAGEGREYVTHPDSAAVWPTTALTYGFVNYTGDVSQAAQKAAVRRAFAMWASVTPLTFTLVPDCGLPQNDPGCTSPDIRIGFYGRDHGPDEWDPIFTGRGGTVAHAFYGLVSTGTLAGDIHFDESEVWTTNLRGGVDIQAVALHEIGHVLGVKHSTQAGCNAATGGMRRPTMCLSFSRTDRILAPDDVAAARSLYGAAGVTCGGYPVTVSIARRQRTTAADNVVLGTNAANTIDGRGGRDIICGLGGADTLLGGEGGDRLVGGNGRDVCDGQAGRDSASTCEVRRSIP